MDIGGFFGYERFPEGKGLDQSAGHHFASARQALQYWLTARRVKRLHMAGWMCPAVLDAADAAGAEIRCTPLRDGELLFDPPAPGRGEAVLLLNPFGLFDAELDAVDLPPERIIVDDTMAFFRGPRYEAASFNSWRKFLPVPDGATLWAASLPPPPERPRAPDDDDYLNRRKEEGAEAAYAAFRSHEAAIAGWPTSRPSYGAEYLLGKLDRDTIIRRRRRNFRTLQDALGATNQLAVPALGLDTVPMTYPYLPAGEGLHEAMWARRIWVPRLWIDDPRLKSSAWEKHLAHGLLPLPIDHRYRPAEMHRIADVLRELEFR